METVLGIAVLVGGVALAVWLYGRSGSDAYWRAYDRAQLLDLKYAREHPGCSYADAHRERDRVMRKYRRY